MLFEEFELCIECYVMFKFLVGDDGVDDLLNIGIMGFWGEVIFFIGLIVCLFIVIQVCGEGDVWMIMVEGGVSFGVVLVVFFGWFGICVEVWDLFYVIFVWLKFFKSECLENQGIFDVIKWLVMLWLDVGFFFILDGCKCFFVVVEMDDSVEC